MTGYKIKLFTIAFFLFLITDLIWLGLIAKNFYFEQYGLWLRLENGQLKPIWWATFMVYLLFSLSIILFIMPLAENILWKAALYGAALGAIIYGVYDFTCIGIFKNFPIFIGIVDWAWGTVLYSWCSIATCYLSRLLNQAAG